MPIEVLMPALSPTMEKGNLAKWHKKEGDAVKSGDVIAEIETDKATMEVEAVDEGTLGSILVLERVEESRPRVEEQGALIPPTPAPSPAVPLEANVPEGTEMATMTVREA